MVDLTANQLVVGEGGTLILTCNVTRGNPMSYTYVWTHVGGAGTLAETSDTLTLSGFTMSDMGMYRCEVTNAAGTGMDSITIEFGGQTLKLEYSRGHADKNVYLSSLCSFSCWCGFSVKSLRSPTARHHSRPNVSGCEWTPTYLLLLD